MPRPRKCRKISWRAGATYFKPRGIPMKDLQEVELSLEEIEAVRLTDFLGLEQIEAAKKMKTSQSTFQRILKLAHNKIAQSLVEGMALRIEKND